MEDEMKPPGWVDRLTGASREDWDDSNSSTVAQLLEHPAPWTWGIAGYPEQINGKPATLALYDANGTEIVGTDGDDWSWVSCDSARVRALLAAAPEMEALLRENWNDGDDDDHECSHTPIPTTVIDGQVYRTDTDRDRAASYCGGACFRCRQRALLARIDAAKGG